MEYKITTKKIISPTKGWGLGNEYTVCVGDEEVGKFTFAQLVEFLTVIEHANRGNLPTMSKAELLARLKD